MGRMNDLPREIVFDILCRLPTESALDCKLVCKPWRYVVSHPSFGQMHLARLNNSTSDDDDDDSGSKVTFIYFNYDQELYYVECDEGNRDEMFLTRKKRISLRPAFQNCSFVGSHNGLVCFKSWVNSYYGPAYICNPVTREYLILPNHVGVYYWNGFGYCAISNEYKVVRISRRPYDQDTGIAQVYTLGSGNGWRNLGDRGINWKNMNNISVRTGVTANGALHWVNLDDGTILAFDLTDEMFSELPAPYAACHDVQIYPVHLGVLGDFLSATYHFDANSSEIWSLKKNKDNSVWSWSKQFTLDKYIELSLEFRKSGRLLCCGLENLYSYNPKASSAKMDTGIDISIFRAVPHKNTLVSLRALGEKDTKTMEFGEEASSSEVTETSVYP